MRSELTRKLGVPVAALSLAGFASLGLLASPVSGDAAPTCGGRTATIVGTAGPNELDGTAGPDVIVGLGGNDHIEGHRGNDVVCGNRGNDELEGDRGNDRLYGGRGYDKAEGGAGSDVCRAEKVEGC